jgi:hypothetical protein
MRSTSGDRPSSWLVPLTIAVALAGCASPVPTAGQALAATPSPTASPALAPTSVALATPVAAVATPTPIPTETPAAAPWSPTPSEQADARVATNVATRYEQALSNGARRTAWDLLAPGPLRPGTYEDFVRFGESPQAQASAYRRFVITPATRDPAVLGAWMYASLAEDLALRADPSRAYVVLVWHPDVVGASASGETFLVAPLRDGSWRICRAH